MRLEPLYRVRFAYPESWAVGLDGGWQQLFFIAEGRWEGTVTGRFRGANFARREGAAGPFRPDFRAVIEADDGAVIMVEWHGYGSTGLGPQVGRSHFPQSRVGCDLMTPGRLVPDTADVGDTSGGETEQSTWLAGNVGGAWRIGGTVHRTTGPWTAAVHALLD